MNVKKMSLEELEQLSEADIAYELLKSNKKPMNTPKLFGEVCKLLKIDDDKMMDMIGDFYTISSISMFPYLSCIKLKKSSNIIPSRF